MSDFYSKKFTSIRGVVVTVAIMIQNNCFACYTYILRLSPKVSSLIFPKKPYNNLKISYLDINVFFKNINEIYKLPIKTNIFFSGQQINS